MVSTTWGVLASVALLDGDDFLDGAWSAKSCGISRLLAPPLSPPHLRCRV